MKILVIGGNGFLGYHLVNQLLKKNHNVTILDLNLNNLKNFKKVKKIKGDFTNRKILSNAINNKDCVFHLAGVGDLDYAMKNPIKVIKYNIEGTARVLNECRKHKIKRFIYASSIYSISQEGSFYRFGKKAAEDYIMEYSKQYNLNYTILRYGSLYGPRSPKNNGVRKIIEKAIKSKQVTYYGSIKNKRKYIFVRDASICSVEILKNKYKNMIINLTGKKKISVNNVLRITANNLRIINKIKYLNKKVVGHYISEPKLIKINKGKNIYIKNSTTLNDGLSKTINYYRNLINEKKK